MSAPSIERYTVEGEIGSGAFGAVYRARHVMLGRPVALKVLLPQRAGDTALLQRFLREARAVAQLGSAHIVQVLDADVTGDGRAFIAMELLSGEDLAHRLTRARMPTHEVLRIGREILAGLTVAHAQGIVHRDLKPANVFLAVPSGGGEVVAKILDFGISKVRTEEPQEELTRTGTLLGTPHYMAPEQFRDTRSVDGRADLYALGVLLYEALAGKLPHEGATLPQLIATKLTDPPVPLTQIAPNVPRAVSDAVMRALEDDLSRRYASASEMDAALALAQNSVSAPGVSLPPRAMPTLPMTSSLPRARSRVLPWLAGGIASVLLLGMFAIVAVTMIGLFLARNELTTWIHGEPSAPVTPAPAPALTPAPAPTPAPVPALTPAPAVAGVQVTATSMGMVDAAGVSDVAARAQPALAACRTATAFHEDVQFVVAMGGALMPSGLPATGATHACVVSALENAGPVRTVMSGIARFDVTLDPR